MRTSTASDEAPPSGDVEITALRAYGSRAANGWRPSGVHEARLPTRVWHPLGYLMGRTHATFHLREPPLACVRFRRRLDGSRLESFRPSSILAERAPARFSILRTADFDRISVAWPPPRGAEMNSRPSAFHCSKPAVPRPHARRRSSQPDGTAPRRLMSFASGFGHCVPSTSVVAMFSSRVRMTWVEGRK